MTGKLKIIILLLVLILIGVLYLYKKSYIFNPDARTLYEGYVEFKRLSLQEIKAKLETFGCSQNDYKGNNLGKCTYEDTTIPYLNLIGLEIYPNGPGFGPVSFSVGENKIWARKDLPGRYDLNKFKEAVREDAIKTGNIFKIRENTWKITRTEYPWTVIY